MKKLIKLVQIVFISVFVFIPTIKILAQDSLPYFGQTPPGSIPIRFAKTNLLSNGIWWWRTSPVFSPDGKEMFFAKYHSDIALGNHKLYYMKDVNGVWTTPEPPTFASDSDDYSPVYANNGNTLFFSSRRSGTMKIYFVNRATNDWTEPQLLAFPYETVNGEFSWDISMSNNGTIYYTVWENSETNIYKSVPVNGIYSTYEKLPNTINSTSQDNSAFIAPDESYLIFASNRAESLGFHDLYISFRNPMDSSWSSAQNMGSPINASHEDAAPTISPDGKYLFFTSARVSSDYGYNSYWVNTSIINQFNPYLGINEKTLNNNSFKIIPNPCDSETTLFFELDKTENISITIYNSLGNKVAEIIKNKTYPKGKHEIKLNVSNLVAGSYYCTLISEKGALLTTKVIVKK